jgi:hypothetical protein
MMRAAVQHGRLDLEINVLSHGCRAPALLLRGVICSGRPVPLEPLRGAAPQRSSSREASGAGSRRLVAGLQAATKFGVAAPDLGVATGSGAFNALAVRTMVHGASSPKPMHHRCRPESPGERQRTQNRQNQPKPFHRGLLITGSRKILAGLSHPGSSDPRAICASTYILFSNAGLSRPSDNISAPGYISKEMRRSGNMHRVCGRLGYWIGAREVEAGNRASLMASSAAEIIKTPFEAIDRFYCGEPHPWVGYGLPSFSNALRSLAMLLIRRLSLQFSTSRQLSGECRVIVVIV